MFREMLAVYPYLENPIPKGCLMVEAYFNSEFCNKSIMLKL